MDQVLFYSRSGKTKKIAEAIAEELGVKAGDVKASSLDPGTKIVFLGSGCYGGKPGDDMVKFIEKNDFANRKVALFGTSGGGEGKEVQGMAEALKKKGANIIGSYNCKGQFIMFVSRGHPNREDIDAAKRFAREMVKKS